MNRSALNAAKFGSATSSPYILGAFSCSLVLTATVGARVESRGGFAQALALVGGVRLLQFRAFHLETQMRLSGAVGGHAYQPVAASFSGALLLSGTVAGVVESRGGFAQTLALAGHVRPLEITTLPADESRRMHVGGLSARSLLVTGD